MNHSEKYYKELLIIKRTKDFLLEKSYDKSRMYPDEYNYGELKDKLSSMNSLFELNKFGQLITQDKKEKYLLTKQLNKIQQGALSTFCTYIVEEPIGFSYVEDIDDTDEYYASFSEDDSDISGREALDEIINELRQLEKYQRTFLIEKIFKEHIYNVAYSLSIQETDCDDFTRMIADVGSPIPQELLEYRIQQYNGFIIDLIKEMYYWFDIDVIKLLSKEFQNNHLLIFSIGRMTLDHFEKIRDAIKKEKKGDINSEDLNIVIKNLTSNTNKSTIADNNKSLLTQNQLVILFEKLRKNRVINGSTSDTMIGYCIAWLAGFKNGDKIRQSLSKNTYVDILDKESNRKAVKIILEEIISEL